jgi:hypothetical protein
MKIELGFNEKGERIGCIEYFERRAYTTDPEEKQGQVEYAEYRNPASPKINAQNTFAGITWPTRQEKVGSRVVRQTVIPQRVQVTAARPLRQPIQQSKPPVIQESKP